MSEEEDELDEFEEQIRQQKAASAETNEIIEHGRIRKDSDGTEFEWDADKKAWFPKVSRATIYWNASTDRLISLTFR